MFNFGILWNNARNLHYIKKFNPKKITRLADNKQKTKIFLWERGVPFAETFALIKNQKELSAFEFSQLPQKEFVVKPNHGSKGKGIAIVSYVGEEEVEVITKKKGVFSFLKKKKKAEMKKKHLFKISGEILDEEEMKFRFADILDGKFSMTSNDSILIEEKLTAGSGFKEFCQYGLADIRIIVFNLVPVAAMIRIPTEKSEGKANINSGGIGCGIDIGTGKTTTTLHEGRIYGKHFPAESKEYQGKRIPFWDDLLFLSSKIQYFVNLGYLALDWVITEDGPKLLEINARAGLEVQKIADIRLQNILNKIKDVAIHDPQKGVEIAKTLFTKEQKIWHSSKILYLSQPGILRIKGAEVSEDVAVQVQVDLSKKNNSISPALFEKITNTNQSLYIDLPENYILLRQLDFKVSEKLGNEIILGKNVAEEYLIKPMKMEKETANILRPEVLIDSELAALHQLDDKIDLLHRRLNLTSRLRPKNYFDELDNFISWKGNYSPIFSYNFPEVKKMQQRLKELKQVKEQCVSGNLKSPVLKLFDEKVDELFVRHQLLTAYIKQDFWGIEEGNRLLRGDFDEELLKLSKEKIGEREEKELLGKIVPVDYLREKIEKKLDELGIFWVEIVENASSLSRMSITMGKEVKINISQGVELREGEIDAIIAHEIETHLLRFLNGKKSWRKIFSSGTANYLRDEEGLAIWNAKQKLPEGYESLGIYKKYYLLNEAEKLDFKQLFELASIVYPHYSTEGRFKICIRIKKGIIHAKHIKGHSWRKNKVYLEGYHNASKIKNKEALIYQGKIRNSDLSFVK